MSKKPCNPLTAPSEIDRILHGQLPDKDHIKTYIEKSGKPVDKRDLAKAFGLKGAQRKALKELLQEMTDEGLIDRGHKKKIAAKNALPEVSILTIERMDRDGELWAKPVKPDEAEGLYDILITDPPGNGVASKSPSRGAASKGPAPKVGDRILARLKRLDDQNYQASIIRVLPPGPRKLLGVLQETKSGALLIPTDKKLQDKSWFIREDQLAGAKPGDLVLADPLQVGYRGRHDARVKEVIGPINAPKAFSLIAIHSQGLPVAFPEPALEEAQSALPVTPVGRTDLREIPLVTIDGEDARDFDDALFAEPDTDPENPDGHKLLVAIADVAHYVKPDGPLDRAAIERGNSVYFPDRVVPMLPERLSNDLCSLRPDEDKACMAIHMRINRDGKLIERKLVRGIMRSVARLTYIQVQDAIEGRPVDEKIENLVHPVLHPLYAAYETLLRNRASRGTLELDLPELQILIGDDGKVEKIAPRQRLDSHKLIEEFMITANVAAAELLEARNARAIMYRTHAPPALDKLESLKESLLSMGLKIAGDGVLKPHHFTRILSRVAGTEKAPIVSELVLRSQSQAVYSPENDGHFGLSLNRYCHFTSPIRRYSDILVHRALISAYGLGESGLPDAQAAIFEKLGDVISHTERRAIAAERDAKERYLTAYMSDLVGARFSARITGVKQFGLFVRLDETAAEGLVPVSNLPWDRYWHDEIQQKLIGQDSGQAYQLAEQVTVRLTEANTVTGGLAFDMVSGGHIIKDRKSRTPRHRQRGKHRPWKSKSRRFKTRRPGRP